LDVVFSGRTVSYDLENGTSGVVSLGASVGLFIFMYYVLWLFASKFSDFSFNLRVMNQMYRANVKSFSDTQSQKSHISRMSQLES
jgi:hypothetical protein